MLALAIDNVEIVFLDRQGPSRQKTFHLLSRQLLQGRVIRQQGKLVTQKVIPKLFLP